MNLPPQVGRSFAASRTCLWAIALILAIPPNAYSQTEAELFAAVFGKAPPKPQGKLFVPLRVDGAELTQLWVFFPEDGKSENTTQSQSQSPQKEDPDPSIEWAPLRDVLQPRVVVDWTLRVDELIDAKGRIPLKSLNEAGLPAVFDKNAVQLNVEIPPRLRRLTQLTLTQRTPSNLENSIRSAPFSGFINARIAATMLTATGASIEELNRKPLTGGADFAFNLYQWVLEGRMSFRQANAIPVRRGNLTLTHDFVPQGLRLQIGDVTTRPRGFQSSMPLGGVSIFRNFSVQPYRTVTPMARHRFYLHQPGTVEVYINGVMTREMALPAGPFDLRDFPVSVGLNDIVLKIRDDGGYQEVISIPVSQSTGGLARGIHDFSWTIGLPWSFEDGVRRYIPIPTQSFFHRMGLNENLSFGTHLEASTQQGMLGTEWQWNSPIGSFETDVAMSIVGDPNQGIRVGGAIRARYAYLDNRKRNRFGLRGSVEVVGQTDAFAQLGDLSPNPRTITSVTGALAMKLPWKIRLGLGGLYNLSRGDNKHSGNFSLFLRRQFSRGLLATIDLSDRIQQDGHTFSLNFGVAWTIPSTDHFVAAAFSPLDLSGRADWQYAATPAVGGIRAGARANANPENAAFSTDLAYLNRRFATNIDTDLALALPQDDANDPSNITPTQTRTATVAQIATSMVFTHRAISWSRPVSGSFAIIDRKPTLENTFVGVNPQSDDSYVSQIDALGPAVIPDITPYHSRNITLEAPELQAGLDLGQTHYLLNPGYRSGIHLVVGSNASVLATGILQDAEGVPIALIAGEAIPQSQGDIQDPVIFFTSQDGGLAIDGLGPGTFKIVLYDGRGPIFFTIQEDASGIVDIGTLSLPKAQTPKEQKP